MGCHLQRRWCRHPTGHGVMAGGASCSPGISAFPKPLVQPSRSQALVRGTTRWLAVFALDSVSCLCVPVTQSGHPNVCGAPLYLCLRSLAPHPCIFVSSSESLLFLFSSLPMFPDFSGSLSPHLGVSLLQAPRLLPFCVLGLLSQHRPLSRPALWRHKPLPSPSRQTMGCR